MKRSVNILLGAILAGIAIGIGGAVFLSLENKIVGALMFTVGLYAICANALFLFTGKVGYLPEQPPAYLLDLVIIWVGNLLGTGLVALLLRCTRVASLAQTAEALCTVKLGDNLLSLFVLGIFCGLLMFIAVDGYKGSKNPLILFVCVSVFILCGFEHCIADMFYFSMAGAWNARAVLEIVVITLGNTMGGVLIPLWKKTLPKT